MTNAICKMFVTKTAVAHNTFSVNIDLRNLCGGNPNIVIIQNKHATVDISFLCSPIEPVSTDQMLTLYAKTQIILDVAVPNQQIYFYQNSGGTVDIFTALA